MESRFGRPVPDAVRSLYADREMVARTDFSLRPPAGQAEEIDRYIDCFEPLDAQTLGDFDLWQRFCRVGGQWLPFAGDGFGNYYLVNMSTDYLDRDAVYFFDHEGLGGLVGEVGIRDAHYLSKVADSLEEFLSWQVVDGDDASDDD